MTAGGAYGAGGPAAGWYPDPQNPAGQRYWDGAGWTQHTAPGVAAQVAPAFSAEAAPPQHKTRWGLIIGIVAGVGVLIIVVLAAIAIPVFQSQRAKAQDTSAKADVATLGKEVATWYVDHDGRPPAVTVSGGKYSVDHVAVGHVSPNVQLGGIRGTGATDWCVWVTNPEGEFKDYQYSAKRGLGPGTC